MVALPGHGFYLKSSFQNIPILLQPFFQLHIPRGLNLDDVPEPGRVVLLQQRILNMISLIDTYIFRRFALSISHPDYRDTCLISIATLSDSMLLYHLPLPHRPVP